MFDIVFFSVIKLLCERGADPTLSDIEGNRPVDLARKNGHLKCVLHLENFTKGLLKSRINGSVNVSNNVIYSRMDNALDKCVTLHSYNIQRSRCQISLHHLVIESVTSAHYHTDIVLRGHLQTILEKLTSL